MTDMFLHRRHLLALAALLPVTACSPASLLTGGKTPRVYVLTPAHEFAPDLPQVSWPLLVERPLADAAVDTPRIVLGETANRLSYFSDASWADNGPDMMRSLLVQSFENSHRIASVGAERSGGLRVDYILKTELRAFNASYYGQDPGKTAPDAVVRVNAKLVRMPRRDIVADQTFDAKIRAAGPGLDDIVQAFDRATGDATRRIVEWTLTQGAADVAAHPQN